MDKLNNKKVAVISDTHIGYGVEDMTKLYPLLESYDFIIFNGDIFELYAEDWETIKNGSGKSLLSWMEKNPKKFVYVVGNHDDKLWRYKGSLPFKPLEKYEFIQNDKYFICIHGHQFDKRTLNNWFFKVEHFVSNLFKFNLQKWLEDKNFWFVRRRIENTILLPVRSRARSYVINKGCDYLIHGHTHHPNEERVENMIVIDQGRMFYDPMYVEIKNGIPVSKTI